MSSRRLAAALGLVAAINACGPKRDDVAAPKPAPIPAPTTHVADVKTNEPVVPAPPPAPPVDPPSPAPPPEEGPALRKPTEWTSPTKNGIERMAEARAAKLETVQQLFAAASVAFPPAELLLRVYKQEKRLEVWASGSKTAPLAHVSTYQICYASGALGPKRREGDRQVPEGFYSINFLNPWSAYYLAMQVSYPNAADRFFSDPRAPGGEIMVHGNCVSIGCIAMMDERMQEIWVTTTETRKVGGGVHVHIFPARDIAGLIEKSPQSPHIAFWQNIKEGHDFFERTRKIPVITVAKDGRYAFREAGTSRARPLSTLSIPTPPRESTASTSRSGLNTSQHSGQFDLIGLHNEAEDALRGRQ